MKKWPNCFPPWSVAPSLLPGGDTCRPHPPASLGGPSPSQWAWSRCSPRWHAPSDGDREHCPRGSPATTIGVKRWFRSAPAPREVFLIIEFHSKMRWTSVVAETAPTNSAAQITQVCVTPSTGQKLGGVSPGCCGDGGLPPSSRTRAARVAASPPSGPGPAHACSRRLTPRTVSFEEGKVLIFMSSTYIPLRPFKETFAKPEATKTFLRFSSPEVFSFRVCGSRFGPVCCELRPVGAPLGFWRPATQLFGPARHPLLCPRSRLGACADVHSPHPGPASGLPAASPAGEPGFLRAPCCPR